MTGRPGRTAAVLLLALAGSVAVNVGLVLRYRVPPGWWPDPDEEIRARFPDIPLSGRLAIEPLRPALAAPAPDRTVDDFALWGGQGRDKLRELLGQPSTEPTFTARQVRSDRVGGLVRETLVFTQPDGLEVPAFLHRPDDGGRRTALLVIPGHSWGIVATSGIVDDYQNGNALQLAREGYVTLTMEVRGFGYLQHFGGAEPPLERNSYVSLNLVRGGTSLGVTVQDQAAGLSYLAARPDVRSDRLGLVGFSSGCDAAIYLGALDPRPAVIVLSGCVSSHESKFSYSRRDAYSAVPGLARWLGADDCLGLLAPRPVLVHWGERDDDPSSHSAAFNPTALATFDAALRIYRAQGAGESLEKHVTPGVGHQFDVGAAIDFLRRRLPPR